MQAARQDPSQMPPGWHDKLPVFLRLRDFAQQDFPPIENLLVQGKRVQTLAGRVPTGWTAQQLDSGRVLLLLDGLDEVNQSKREAAYNWLEGLLTLYPRTLYIVSSRPSTLQDPLVEARWQRANFLRLDLQNMDDAAVRQFIQQWHQAMADERCLLSPTDKADLPQLADQLQQAIQQQSRLRDLARNPLLCALLCALHQSRRSQLPADRVQLYQTCLEMLLEGRDQARNVDMGDYDLGLTLRQKQRLLAGLAYWMMHNDEPVISQADALRELGRSGAHSEAVLRLLVERSGLLQTQTADSYDFTHRTFQEYLAAQEITHRGYVRAVYKQHALNEAWQETLRLTASFASEADQKILLQILQDTAKAQDEANNYLHTLALEAFSMMVTPTSPVRHQAQMHAVALITEDNKLDLDNTAVSDLSPLASLSQLRRLDLDSTAVSDLSPLASLSRLRWLDLDNTAVSDLSPLASLSQLQRLYLNKTAVTDLSPLSSLPHLMVLDVRETPITDFSPLRSQPALKALWVTETTHLQPDLTSHIDINPTDEPFSYWFRHRQQ